MPEEILFKSESKQSRADVATYLRSVADKLDAGEPITLVAGSDERTMTVPGTVEFEVKAERETSKGGGNPELSIEFELEWAEGADDEPAGDLRIE